MGFFGAMERAWDYGRLVESQLGVQEAMANAEAENIQRVKRATGKTMPSVLRPAELPNNYKGDFLNLVREPPIGTDLATAIANDDSKSIWALTQGRNEELARLQAQYPGAGIQTYADMYQGVKDRYTKLKLQQEQSYTLPGEIGHFAGMVGAGVDPRVNPLGFATLPIGGVGKGVATRVISQGAAQGAVQAVEEVTGVRANKQALGENPSLGQSVGDVAFAAVGGAALQGVGEVAGAGFRLAKRRWFGSAPGDAAPPLPTPPKAAPVASAATPVEAPLAAPREPAMISAEADARITQAVREAIGVSRSTARVAKTDYAHVAQNLEDWQGPRPWEVPPTTASRLPQPGEPVPARIEPNAPGETVDEIARRIDPDTFKLYDKTRENLARNSTMLSQTVNAKGVEPAKALAEATNLVDELTHKLDEVKNRGAIKPVVKTAENELAKAKEARDTLYAQHTGEDLHSAQRSLRQREDAHQQLLQLGPSINRAYARARGEWNLHDAQRQQIEEMLKTAGPTLPPAGPSIVDKAEAAARVSAEPLRDVVPELNSPGVEQKIGEPAVGAVKRVQTEDAKAAEKVTEAFVAAVPRMLKAEGDKAKITIDGINHTLSLSDEIFVTGEDGLARKMTLRDVLKSVQEDQEVLQAVTSCSVGLTSATA